MAENPEMKEKVDLMFRNTLIITPTLIIFGLLLFIQGYPIEGMVLGAIGIFGISAVIIPTLGGAR
jgi:hypothetical protein